jgi:hypothetical protein
MSKSMENWNISDSETINQLPIIGKAIIDLEYKFCLPKSSFVISQSCVKDIVIVIDSWLSL